MKQVLALLLAFAAFSAQAQEVLSHGRFSKITMYQPKGTPSSFVIFMSGDGGWNEGVINMAKALTSKGALVAGIDTPAFFRNLEKDPNDCVFPDGDLENLSHFLQAYYKLSDYYRPVLVGYSSGATLAYAMLAQAPDNTFGGGMALGFGPDLGLKKPLCKAKGEGEGVKFEMQKNDKGLIKGALLQPVTRIKAPFVALQGEIDQVVLPAATQNFVAQVTNAEVVLLPKVGHGYSVEKNWMPQYLDAYDRIVVANKAASPPPPPSSLGNLPVIEIPAKGDETDTFAVIISGDGGWAGLDKEVAASLSAKGVKVVGVDSLRYFWVARTPDGTAADVDRIIRYYAANWKKKHVLLIGYSQGADVMPFVVTRLSKESRALVSLAAGMGLSEHAAFEFHLTNWVSNGSEGPETLPEVARINGIPFLCIYGADEKDTICPKLEKTPSARVVKLPGGHHFNGNYELLAEQILKAMPK
jgi:type IV secretory pathway VirJ component